HPRTYHSPAAFAAPQQTSSVAAQGKRNGRGSNLKNARSDSASKSMRSTFAIAVLCTVLACATAQVDETTPQDRRVKVVSSRPWPLVFSDEFAARPDEARYNTSKWTG